LNRRAELKDRVRGHWQAQPCGTRELPAADRRAFFKQLALERYQVEPYLWDFAQFERGKDLRLLEVGVGAGTDFINWVRHGANATGIDLTEQGVALTRERLALEGLSAQVQVGDAEDLPFPDASFDLVYSYGVLHHSPDTPKAIHEVLRVLVPGGRALIMIYHLPSWTGWMLWALHALGKLRPWRSPRWAIYHHLESPGTKAYTKAEARKLFQAFTTVQIRTQLGNGDLLKMRPATKYASLPHRVLWHLYPRWLVRRMGNRFGLLLFIEATKGLA